MKRSAWFPVAIFAFCAFLFSCGGDGSVSVVASTGSVTFYATDDISHFQEVTATVNKVQLVETGTSTTCDILTTPQTVNLTDLASLFELLSTTECPAQSYNRIHIEFESSVPLVDNTGFMNDTCMFTSYKDQNNNPNVLNCSGDTCSLDITGAINVLANKTNALALDFDLKNFDVSGLDGSNCSVTIKVSPLNASDMNGKMLQGYTTGVTGTISGLDTGDRTFTITGKDMSFTVNYSGVTQTGIDDLLQLAENGGLKVSIRAPDLDVFSGTITASAIYVRVKGTVSGLNTGAHTFDPAYTPPRGGTNTITVDYTNAIEIVGTLSDGVTADVVLSGFTGSTYLAHEIKAGG